MPQLVANSIIAGAIYALLALGFNLIYGTVKFFDLGYGAMVVVGGYGVFLFYKILGFPLGGAVLLALLITGLVSVVIDRLVYQRLRARRASSMVLLVAALGVSTVIQAALAIGFSSQFQTLSKAVGAQRIFTIGGGVLTQVQLIILVAALGVMVVLALFLWGTKYGRAIRAIGDDEEVAKIVGVPTDRVISVVFFVSAMIAALAGVLIGFDTGLEPPMGLSLLLKGVIAAIVGGIGNVYGGVVGAFILGFAENFGIWQISGEWKDAIAFGILIVFLLFRPQGIFRR